MITKSFTNTEVEPKWFVVDASDQILGRLASSIAHILRGKHKPEYTPHSDLGDYIVVINAKKIKVTGNKLKDKTYYHHTGYPGGIKSKNLETILDQDATQVIKSAVKGMLPKNKLGKLMITKLKVYEDQDHPHIAQNPLALTF
ncbi:MAG: 50S ribosomal protein L13 [SAR86 cluster bacterium]|jgi:large subunit ribosomal protein L13|nr:50S ribosomal protein L13 [SAR86 cluster bacterium]